MASRRNYATNDYELHYASLKKSLEEQYPDRHDSHVSRRRMPVVPDMRFEQGFLQSIRPYVRIERAALGRVGELKGEEHAPSGAGERRGTDTSAASLPREMIEVQWGRVMWITARDQIISPLIQGVLRGVAGVFLVPLLPELKARLHAWWARGAAHPGRPLNEGHGVGVLRSWAAGLTAGSVGSMAVAK
ncbi:hypothetical protein WOLCODRAFT_125559 [Wolfiporia cocos MD-104 SS10]|uniref:Uncharacterized protein n=1 Tax=Wolfiporia cocos (strain MD-104) TaxID=742152 RepID=A0A2H3J8W7_WOLCO|nr:hypothetical protein WOLCODRAFT_125559 [Wolfiporia cocos MD-104 SS10]